MRCKNMEEIQTRFGTCKIEKTGVDYQVVAYYSKLDEKDIEVLKQYFNNIGKFEEIMKGICITTQFLGLSSCKEIQELSSRDIEKPIDIHKSRERKRIGYIDIYFRGRNLDEYEKKESNTERILLNPKIIAQMIKNIDNYNSLKQSWNEIQKL
jgi:hypothetical protein